MRLSTERDRDEARSIAVLHAAFDAGITLLDTADAYCWDDSERGHNERLIARALETWAGDRSRVRAATKGGLTRPDGSWEADGRASYLLEACERSRRALGVEQVSLYQLHAPDPRTPLATSVRALANLKQNGLIQSVGLCNVTVGQIEEARRITGIEAVQVELSIWNDHHVLSGVVDYCIAHRIRLLAYRPLGGPSRYRKTMSDPALVSVAARHRATPPEIAMAWLMDLSDLIVPLPGATRVETVRSIARVRRITLTDQDRAELDGRFPFGRAVRSSGLEMADPEPDQDRNGPRRGDGEVVLVMGSPGAGKSTFARTLVEQGYRRLNRDEAGGTLTRLVPALDAAVRSGMSRIVLDNTYPSRKSRAEVIRAASAHGLSVRCVWLSTSIEDAQMNAVWRIVSRYGRLPGDRELRSLQRKDPAALPPAALFRYRRELEPPDMSEGFAAIDIVPFQRRIDPSFTNSAVIVSCEDVILSSRSGLRMPLVAEDVEIIPNRATVLRRYQGEGRRLLGISWQPEIADGRQSAEGVETVFVRMRELLDLDIEVEYCPHGAGPPNCWCRKPLPGLGVVFIHRHRLDPARCIFVGSGPQDPGFARRLGFVYQDAADLFASHARHESTKNQGHEKTKA
jgi:aryl-alcohol dehydrogenase-like predicted oxidoreductase/predicted kinase/histidinol phosphatase-like enzyme